LLYHTYEITHASITPVRSVAQATRNLLRNPFNPASRTLTGRTTAAYCEMFVNATKRYGKPEFGLDETEIDGRMTPVVEEVVLKKPFCELLHFRRQGAAVEKRNDPKVLIVAPLSGHFATLLRGTVEAMLPEHDVYITDWIDARMVPINEGLFDLDDYIDYVIEFIHFLSQDGERVPVMAVCQPSVPALAATALMSEDGDPMRPASLTLLGGPIDTRLSPTKPNDLANKKSLNWFEKNVITLVPWPHKGVMRRVYPGFVQLSGFVSINLDRHMSAALKQFRNLIKGDGDSAASHRAFYDEYNSVMDMTAEYYLQTIDTVFQRHLMPRRMMKYRGRLVNLSEITDVALMTVEGEFDDITGCGQTEAAHGLCDRLPDELKLHYTQPKVGHYGVFNGSRFRRGIQPRIRDFIRAHRAPVAQNRNGWKVLSGLKKGA